MKNKCVFLCAMILLVSCSSSMDVRIVGALGKKILFTLYEHNKVDPITVNVLDVTVFKIINHNRVAVWRIHGSANVNQIEFGRRNEGLLEIKESEDLAKSYIYGVSISAGGGFIAYASSYFCFSGSGSIIQFISLNKVSSKCELR